MCAPGALTCSAGSRTARYAATAVVSGAARTSPIDPTSVATTSAATASDVTAVVNDASAAQAARPLLRVSGAGAPVDLLQAQRLGRSLALQLCAAGAVRSQA